MNRATCTHGVGASARTRALGSPVHTHQHEDEYSIALERTVGVQIGDKQYQAGPGAVVVKPRGIHTPSGTPPTNQHACSRSSPPPDSKPISQSSAPSSAVAGRRISRLAAPGGPLWAGTGSGVHPTHGGRTWPRAWRSPARRQRPGTRTVCAANGSVTSCSARGRAMTPEVAVEAYARGYVTERKAA